MDKKLSVTRINVWVDPAFYHQLKVQAALKNVTLKEFVIAALQEKLKQK
jgi:predicted HicB family RNase H-like nuclease